jgi:hypothetical protein
MVAEKALRVRNDFVPKVRHTVDVIHAVVAAVIAVSGGAGSGLYGKVVISPARPVCVVGQSCTAPDKNDVLTFWLAARRVGGARTDANGRYRIALRPGRYSVTARHGGAIGRGLDPTHAVAPRGRYARVNFSLDIGIR